MPINSRVINILYIYKVDYFSAMKINEYIDVYKMDAFHKLYFLAVEARHKIIYTVLLNLYKVHRVTKSIW